MSTGLVARDVWAAPPGAPESVLRGFSLEVRPGEWVAVGGPNGGGKTTLALVLAGLWRGARGSVELDGVPVEARRLEIAVVLQDPANQMLTSTVGEELACTARNLGRPAAEVEPEVRDWAEFLGLEPDLGRDPRTLSAGRQQVVLLAAAMIARPRLLVADEPAVHLDRETRSIVLDRVRRDVNRGLSVVWVTQTRSERDAADRVVWVGGDEAGPSAVPAPSREACPAGIRISVAVWNGVEGPAVRTARALSIDLPARGVICLTGPNGCGKSVVLSAAAGLVDSDQCTLEWKIPDAPPPLMASQYPEQQIFEEKVEDELLFAAVSRGVSRPQALASAANALATMGLDPKSFLERRCWWLSGGERRIVSVLSALMAPCSLLALDEPSAGLDRARGSALAGLIIERGRLGPVLVATQDRDWAGGLGAVAYDLGLATGLGLPNLSKKMD